jgi:hypothetical protein
LQLIREHNSGGDCCGEYSYTLCESGSCGDYLVENVEHAIKTMTLSTPWYNSSDETPEWSHSLEGKELEVVEVTVETMIRVLEAKKRLRIGTQRGSIIDTVDVPGKEKQRLALHLCDVDGLLKEGITVEMLKENIGEFFYVGTSSKYRLLDVTDELPEKTKTRYAKELEGKRIIGVIRGDEFY